MNENWRRLKPTDVAKWINFGGVNGEWIYSPDQPVGMAALQTEGVAHLWNVLSRNPVALLADEVGMGKTFEALGVAALLWRRKPDAKILVIAPNRDICAHWQREFSAFTRDLYLKADGFVKAKNDRKPVPPFGAHYRLPELTEAIEQRSEHDTPAQFYITTIHALSGLVDSSDESTDKTAAARRAARVSVSRGGRAPVRPPAGESGRGDELQALRLHIPSRLFGLALSLFGEIHVDPAGKPVFLVPKTLAVSQQNEGHHRRLLTIFRCHGNT